MWAASGGDPRSVILRSNWTNQYVNRRKRLGLHCASPPGPHERRGQLVLPAEAENPEGGGSHLYHLVPCLYFFGK